MLKFLAGGCVVVDREEIGHLCVLPSIVVYHQPGVVEGLREIVERFEMGLLSRLMRQIRHAPAFVDRRPDNDGRMVVIARHHLDPFASHARDGFFVEQVRIGHLGGDQKSHSVRPVQEARIFHFLMLANSIETEFLHAADVGLDCLVGRAGSGWIPASIPDPGRSSDISDYR